MAYDTRTHELVMFGGFAQSGFLNDTWAWDGKGWTARKAQLDPPIKNPSMIYDPANNELLLVGSDVSLQQQNSLWGWKDGGSGWVQQTVWITPSCGKSCAPSTALPFAAGTMTYDSARGRTLMLAYAATGPGNETWTWDGARWIQIPTAHRPSLVSCCLTTDRATGHLLALGYSGNYGGINRLWIFDGTDWALTSTSVPNGDAMMIDDPATNSPLLVRSTDAAGNPSPETWSWNGNAWQRLDVTSPAFPNGSGLGYDAADKQVMVFGGQAASQFASDTWIWNGRSWHKQP